MKWQDLRALPYYEDRLPPGADRSMPGEYGPETPYIPNKVGPIQPQFATLPPTPLEVEAYRRAQAERRLARSYQRIEEQPQTMGLPKSRGGADLAWMGMSPDYPDRMVQRAPTEQELEVRQMLLEEMAKHRDKSSRQTLKQILGR